MVVALEDVRVTSPQSGVALVSVANELDLATRTEFSALLHALIRQNELVVVDFSEALFIDSSTLNVLVSAHTLALERGTRLRLQLGDECVVKRTFEVSGLLAELSWASSREEALNGSAPAIAHDDPGSGALDRGTDTRADDLAEFDYTAWNLPIHEGRAALFSGSVLRAVGTRGQDRAWPEAA